MIQLIGWRLFSIAVAILVIAVGAINFMLEAPTSIWGFLWLFSKTGIVLTAVIFGLGQTAAFPWLCRRIPLKYLVPDLEGRWVGSISSNWATIADKHGLLDQSGKSYEDHPIPVNASIRIRLLNISMELNSDDNYQNSKTLNCTLKRNSHDGFCLSYIYQSTVPHPKESDEQSFYGAALFDIQDRTPLEITGNHWTNRNWHAGLNTAGMIVLKRV